MKKKKDNLTKKYILTFSSLLVVAVCVVFLMQIIVPFILNMVNYLITLVGLFALIDDIRVIFLGGCFFLVVGWYFLVILLDAWLKIIGFGVNTFLEQFKK